MRGLRLPSQYGAAHGRATLEVVQMNAGEDAEHDVEAFHVADAPPAPHAPARSL